MESKTDRLIVIMGALTLALLFLAWVVYLFVSEKRQGRFEQKMLDEARMQTAMLGKEHS